MENLTKNLIADTLVEMIHEKPFDRVTITDLVERCKVSRQTFYYHFADLLDVLELIFNRKVESVITECNTTSDLETTIRIMLNAGLEHQRMLRIILDSRLRVRIEQRLLDAIKKGLLLGFNTLPSMKPLNNEQISMIVEFFSYGIIGVLLYRDIAELDDLDRATNGICKLITNTISRA